MSKKMVKINFASQVRRKEESLGLNRRLTQAEIAEELGITPPTVRNWMNGEIALISVPVLERMLTYFDCNIGDLLIVEEMPEAGS